MFKPYPDSMWAKEQQELKALISSKEFDEAKESSGANLSYEAAKKALLNSHFTARIVTGKLSPSSEFR